VRQKSPKGWICDSRKHLAQNGKCVSESKRKSLRNLRSSIKQRLEKVVSAGRGLRALRIGNG